MFISSLLIKWAFQLTLDLMELLDDMGFMDAAMLNDPLCAHEFEMKIPEFEHKRMIQHYSQVMRSFDDRMGEGESASSQRITNFGDPCRTRSSSHDVMLIVYMISSSCVSSHTISRY